MQGEGALAVVSYKDMLPPQLPPPVPQVAPAPVQEIDFGFSVEIPAELLPDARLAKKPPQKKAKVGPKRKAFDKAVQDFEQSLAKLPAAHKNEILKFHEEVDKWADKKRDKGEKADKLSNFVGRVMIYAHKRLLLIEQQDPKLTRMKREHTELQTLFMNGNEVIETYLAWIRAKNEDEPPKKG